jgi:hypothetical protein
VSQRSRERLLPGLAVQPAPAPQRGFSLAAYLTTATAMESPMRMNQPTHRAAEVPLPSVEPSQPAQGVQAVRRVPLTSEPAVCRARSFGQLAPTTLTGALRPRQPMGPLPPTRGALAGSSAQPKGSLVPRYSPRKQALLVLMAPEPPLSVLPTQKLSVPEVRGLVLAM